MSAGEQYQQGAGQRRPQQYHSNTSRRKRPHVVSARLEPRPAAGTQRALQLHPHHAISARAPEVTGSQRELVAQHAGAGRGGAGPMGGGRLQAHAGRRWQQDLGGVGGAKFICTCISYAGKIAAETRQALCLKVRAADVCTVIRPSPPPAAATRAGRPGRRATGGRGKQCWHRCVGQVCKETRG